MCAESQYSPLYHLACSVPSFWKGHRKLMGIYTGYFDESGDEEQPDFVMGGIVLDAENAADFDRDWRNAIKELPVLNGQPFLHTADFVSGNRQYDPDWKGRYDDKLMILSSAARVINRHSVQVITSALDMEDYREFDARWKLSEAVGHPYAVAAQIAFEHMTLWAKRNSVLTPIKMVLEDRDGIGDVIEMFKIMGHPLPSAESKGLPQLQAADYVAWMRLKRYHPSSPYERVKASWNEINKWLYIDQPYGLSELIRVVLRLSDQHPDISFPQRDDDRTVITYNNNRKRPRRPFKRKSGRK